MALHRECSALDDAVEAGSPEHSTSVVRKLSSESLRLAGDVMCGRGPNFHVNDQAALTYFRPRNIYQISTESSANRLARVNASRSQLLGYAAINRHVAEMPLSTLVLGFELRSAYREPGETNVALVVEDSAGDAYPEEGFTLLGECAASVRFLGIEDRKLPGILQRLKAERANGPVKPPYFKIPIGHFKGVEHFDATAAIPSQLIELPGLSRVTLQPLDVV